MQPNIKEETINTVEGIKSIITMNKIYWQGIYSNFKDVPSEGGFNESSWVNDTTRYAQQHLMKISQDEIRQYAKKSLLTLFSSLILKSTSKISILDVGGGMGVNYIYLKSVIPTQYSLEYHIVEIPEMCAIGEKIYAEELVTFYQPFPDVLPKLDIIYVNSAMQYMENYQDVLLQLSKYSPEYMLFERLSAGEFPTFFTAQVNLPGSVFPYQFINIDEFTRTLNGLGYELIYQVNEIWPYNQSNLPEDYRMQYFPNLLFRKID